MDLRKLGQFHSKTSLFQRRLREAIGFAKRAFDLCENPCVNISAGKDSVAMLAVVSEAAKELGRDFTCWIHISDASFPGTIETAKEAVDLCDSELLISESPVSAFDIDFNKKVKQFGKEGVFFSEIRKNMEENNFDLCFIGNRMYESKRRMQACKAHGVIYKTTVPTVQTICTPIMKFRLEDVAAAIEYYGLPWHPIYFKEHDRGSEGIRLGYITAQDLLNKGTTVFLKKNYPELFNKLSESNPNVRKYT